MKKICAALLVSLMVVTSAQAENAAFEVTKADVPDDGKTLDNKIPYYLPKQKARVTLTYSIFKNTNVPNHRDLQDPKDPKSFKKIQLNVGSNDTTASGNCYLEARFIKPSKVDLISIPDNNLHLALNVDRLNGLTTDTTASLKLSDNGILQSIGTTFDDKLASIITHVANTAINIGSVAGKLAVMSTEDYHVVSEYLGDVTLTKTVSLETGDVMTALSTDDEDKQKKSDPGQTTKAPGAGDGATADPADTTGGAGGTPNPDPHSGIKVPTHQALPNASMNLPPKQPQNLIGVAQNPPAEALSLAAAAGLPLLAANAGSEQTKVVPGSNTSQISPDREHCTTIVFTPVTECDHDNLCLDKQLACKDDVALVKNGIIRQKPAEKDLKLYEQAPTLQQLFMVMPANIFLALRRFDASAVGDGAKDKCAQLVRLITLPPTAPAESYSTLLTDTTKKSKDGKDTESAYRGIIVRQPMMVSFEVWTQFLPDDYQLSFRDASPLAQTGGFIRLPAIKKTWTKTSRTVKLTAAGALDSFGMSHTSPLETFTNMLEQISGSLAKAVP